MTAKRGVLGPGRASRGWDRLVLLGAAGAAVALMVFAVVSALTYDWPLGAGAAPAQPPAATLQPTAGGVELVERYACTACHSVDGGELAGPTWQGLAGSERILEDGSTVIADADYLRRSIVEPGAEIVAGFTNTMPADPGERMTAEEIEAVVAYLLDL